MYHFNKCSSFANNELQSLLHHSSGNFKILMITGMMQDRTNPTAASEVINVESSTSVTCPAVPNFPSAIYASAGTLIQKKMPLVCSGYPGITTCYLLKNNAWVLTGSLIQGRMQSALLPNSPFQNPTHQATII